MSHVGKKRKVDRSGQDRLYFDSYTDVTIHEEMIADHVRTNTYRMAILRNSELIRGRWSWTWGPDRRAQHVLCSRPERRRCSRWRRVRSPNRRNIVQQNNMEDRIEVIRGTVIVSEWMGYALLHESMLNSVLFARDKWLKPGGLILRTKPSSTSPHQRPGGGGPAAVLVHREGPLRCGHVGMYGFARKCIMNSDIAMNSVHVEDTHWKQAVLYLDDAVEVVQERRSRTRSKQQKHAEEFLSADSCARRLMSANRLKMNQMFDV
uniref:Protein arginine N-methyltransferase 6 n=1 Tax=Labrus bergylta TaxID=56723 RepID=A0A3Q3E9L3_9LABR